MTNPNEIHELPLTLNWSVDSVKLRKRKTPHSHLSHLQHHYHIHHIVTHLVCHNNVPVSLLVPALLHLCQIGPACELCIKPRCFIVTQLKATDVARMRWNRLLRRLFSAKPPPATSCHLLPPLGTYWHLLPPLGTPWNPWNQLYYLLLKLLVGTCEAKSQEVTGLHKWPFSGA